MGHLGPTACRRPTITREHQADAAPVHPVDQADTFRIDVGDEDADGDGIAHSTMDSQVRRDQCARQAVLGRITAQGLPSARHGTRPATAHLGRSESFLGPGTDTAGLGGAERRTGPAGAKAARACLVGRKGAERRPRDEIVGYLRATEDMNVANPWRPPHPFHGTTCAGRQIRTGRRRRSSALRSLRGSQVPAVRRSSADHGCGSAA